MAWLSLSPATTRWRMDILLFGAFLLILGFAVHWIVWRVRMPRRPVIALLSIFLGVLFFGLIAGSSVPSLRSITPQDWWSRLHIVVFCVSLSFVYIINYSGLEEDSPTFSMMKFVDTSGPRGRSADELTNLITDDLIVHSRLRSLVEGGAVETDGQIYTVTRKGRFWARLFTVWRRLLMVSEEG